MALGQDMDVDTSLSTPIKKIKGLSLGSPLYPSLNDFQLDNMASQMVNRGYSQTLTNNVLEELNARANELSPNICLSPSNNISTTSASRRNKRYSGIHRAKFNKMESISNHYSVKDRDADSNINKNDMGKRNLANMDIINKKRRTLMGMEETLKLSPVKYTVPQKSSPIKESPQSSPIKKISPSKKSMNLNKLLNEGEGKRSTSLRMAGVSPTRTLSVLSIPKLSKPTPARKEIHNSSPQIKHSIPKFHATKFTNQENKENAPIPRSPSSKTQCLSSFNTHSQNYPASLSNKPTPTLSHKVSIPNLSHKLSIPTLSHKLSIPKLSHKLSIPKLSHKLSIPSLSNKQSSSTFQRPPKPLSKSKSSIHDSIKLIPTQENQAFAKSNSANLNDQQPKRYTIPKPFSLYNKPTISSSQKSLNKFQRFKDKFN
ncbi:uncharacterized protein AC631_00097 [Debaryomyces fabryi]|uniref:Uncharacterized protein n=1 Tax=Debaryomyces fabryi TaxID=58627 RepID=A0A0V1Q6W5_9ASCO|nr:uncharacterized protein AC631_00097 [Debaryomyces fabryi]KSA04226.1 hypothetical protein AC631_00097 [Debaryomyces fabryi]CUM46286.1 unnamed protein product [Debaryomyces fabryi]